MQNPKSKILFQCRFEDFLSRLKRLLGDWQASLATTNTGSLFTSPMASGVKGSKGVFATEEGASGLVLRNFYRKSLISRRIFTDSSFTGSRGLCKV